VEGKSIQKESPNRFHQVHFRVGVANAWEECQLKWIVIMAISYLFGTYLYATQTPEVKRPGKFDLIGKKPKRFIIVFQDLRTIFSMSSLLEE
jgi:predicted membrane channel-forming protein YqfA (hemolysin III family)